MMSLRFCWLFLAVTAMGLLGNDQTPVKATLCSLAQHPEEFIGKTVEVRASVAGNDLWIDDFEQKPACSSWMALSWCFQNR